MILRSYFILVCFIAFCHGSDQAELITKLSKKEWEQTPPSVKKELLVYARLCKGQQRIIDDLQQQIKDQESKNRAFHYVLNPDCRGDKK